MLILAPRRVVAGAGVPTDSARLPWYVDLSKSFFPVILAVLVLRSFLVEPFRIPSESMVPTLLKGDFILVNKFAYGLRLPVLNTRIAGAGHPERGDVVVSAIRWSPRSPISSGWWALPGDRLEYRDKQLFINGQPAVQQPLAGAADPGYRRFEEQRTVGTRARCRSRAAGAWHALVGAAGAA